MEAERVADVLVGEIQRAGVEIVFGLPGGENVEILDALRRASCQFVLVANESSAVFMADAYARLTRRPGMCLTTLGPGATNAVAGIAHAFLDRAPILILTAQVSDRLRPRQTHQFVDIQSVLTPITKQSIRVESHSARTTIREALALTRAGRPGPVHLQITNEVAGELAGAVKKPGVSKRRSLSPTPGFLTGGFSDRGSLDKALALLNHARRPLIVVGLGIEPEAPYDALLALARTLQSPVITTPKAKGSLPGDDLLSAGTIGLTRTDAPYYLLDQADCILAVGLDVVELVKPWETAAPLIWIAPWDNVDPTLAADVELVGVMRPILEQLATVEHTPDAEWGEAAVARLEKPGFGDKERRSDKIDFSGFSLPARVSPQAVLEALQRAVPRETIITTDVGSHKILAGTMWQALTPNSYFLSNGLSSMGYGLPAAIAASLVFPERQVVCLTGDAGLAMVIGELGVLARMAVPLIVVVLNDSALDLIRAQQVRAGKPVFGTEFASPDFVALAKAYGIQGVRVSTPQECTEEFERAVSARRPVLVEAMIDPSTYPTTPPALRQRTA